MSSLLLEDWKSGGFKAEYVWLQGIVRSLSSLSPNIKEMKKNEHSKQGFNEDLKTLSRRITELERERHRQAEIEEEKAKIEHSLRERVKELNCLYGVAELIERHGRSIDQILQGVADLLPSSWQYPEITCGRVIFEDKEYTTSHFKPSQWGQVADIIIGGKKVGAVEVYYLKKMPIIDEGPFLNEERLLIDAVAEHIGRASERIKLEHFLQERVKELSCLYRVSGLIENHGNAVDKILQGIVDVIPGSWQYPDITCARIVLDREEYLTDNFSISQWKQTADITIGRHKIGAVEVYYLEEMPVIGEGPFLKEERLLINAVSERIGRAIERIRAEQQLEVERTALENKNIALHEIMERVQEEKNDMGVRLQANVDKIILPIVYALETEIPQEQLGYVRLLKKNLKEITSPFTNRISKEFSSLSPVEIQICNLIKTGFRTKEVAKLRGISAATVNRHREHIRKKLRISNKNVNLTTYLNSFMAE